MKRIFTILILALASTSVFAQYNDSYMNQFEEELAIDQFMKGREQLGIGGIVLSTTMVFDAVYYGILADSARKPHADADQLYTATIIGGVVTGVGILASLIEFASGYSNTQRAKSMLHINSNGSLCITLPERRARERHNPVPSWERE